jgi:transcriptional antiterminator Rof (Rho-off)
MSDYRPIACHSYERYERAIMHRKTLLCIAWLDTDGASHLETLQPIDLRPRAGEEYLIAHAARGGEIAIRLDRIVRVEPLSDQPM